MDLAIVVLHGATNAIAVLYGAKVGARRFLNRRLQFHRSLISVARSKVTNSILYHPRGPQIDLHPFRNPVILRSDHGSGATTFLCQTLLRNTHPFWWRVLCPPRGLYLTGNYRKGNTEEWFRSVLDSDKEDPLGAISRLLTDRLNEQPVRKFLLRWIPEYLVSTLLHPEPSIIIIDNAEILLTHFCADFIYEIRDLCRACEDCPSMLQIFFIVNSKEAVESLKVLDVRFTEIELQSPVDNGPKGTEYYKLLKKMHGNFRITNSFLKNFLFMRELTQKYSTR